MKRTRKRAPPRTPPPTERYPSILLFPFDRAKAVLFEGQLLVKPCRTPEATGRRIAAALRAVGPGFVATAMPPRGGR